MAETVTGDDCIRWIEDHCCIPEGKYVGKPVRLRPWQKDIIRGIYDTPTRTAIISFGRKNAKTTLAAFLLLLHLCGLKAVPNSQLFSAAQSREQAAILFSLAAKIVRMSPDLRGQVVIRDTAKQLFFSELGTLYRALSAEASTAYGLSPIFVVHDELGQVKGPRSELYEAMETAAGAQENPLSIIISTQAPTDADLLSVLIDDAERKADERIKLYLYTAKLGADPFAEATIKQANPAYGDFLNAEEVQTQARAAKRMPAREAAYRNLVLNQRVNVSNPLISYAVWQAAIGESDERIFLERDVWIGLDLSARNDLTSFVAVAQDEQDIWHVRPFFFAPERGVADRALRDRVPYDVWAQQGDLLLTPGASVDYEFVAEHLVEFCSTCNVREIAFDRWRMDVFKKELERLGAELPLVPFGQGFKDMTPAVDALESLLLNGKIIHGDHPVLNMCAANAVAISDAAGNRKLDKSKSTGRIDGIVAAAMALGRAVASASLQDYASGGLVVI